MNNNRPMTFDRVNFRIPVEFQPLFKEFAKRHGINAQNQWLFKILDLMKENEHQDPVNPESNTKNETLTTGREDPKRSYLEPSRVEIAYMKQKAIQKAKREGALERMKDREEFRKQAMADRYEYEYAFWKKRQEQRNPTRHMTPEEYHDFVQRMNKGGYKNYFGNA